MSEKRENNDVRLAIDAYFSDVCANPSLKHLVLAQAKGEVKVKRKLSVGLIVTLVLILMAVSALAVALLSAQEMVENELVPMAQGNDQESYNEKFTNEELERIVVLAKENDIEMPARILDALEGGQGYYEEETIMAIAKQAFGDIPAGWTLEQQYWFEEIMVAIGFKEVNYHRVPGEGDMTLGEASALAAADILKEFGDDVTDTARWTRYATYIAQDDGEGGVYPPIWEIEYVPFSARDRSYYIGIDENGEISVSGGGGIDGATASQVIDHYTSVYGVFDGWTPETWIAFSEDIRGRAPGGNRGWAFQNVTYILPPENGISQERAGEIALQAVNLEYTTVRNAVCCMDGNTAIWKVETNTLRPEDIGSGKYTAIWLLEIDCLTGEIRDQREFVVGPNSKPLTRWMPLSVYENLPPMPASPNG